MKLRHLLITVLLPLTLLISACSNNASVDMVVDFDKKPDLSIYYADNNSQQDEEKIEKRSSLNYVNTDYIAKLKAGVGETSSTRKSYNEAPKEWDFVIVDVRRGDYYDRGHINGAINIPAEKITKFKGLLPKDKTAMLIFYGDKLTETAADSAEEAIKLGFNNVHVYQEGIQGWQANHNFLAVTSKYANYYISEAAAVNPIKKLATFIDAGNYKQYFSEHIPNAVNINNDNFAQKFLGSIPQNKTSELIIYCSGFECAESFDVANSIITEGYTNVKVYAGGLKDWSANNLPTFGENGNLAGYDVSKGAVKRDLTYQQWDKKLKTDGTVVVDVRRDDEVAQGKIDGSIHIPHTKILADPELILGKLPEDKSTTIIIHCKAGVRAASVVNHIAGLGYNNTYFLDNGISISENGEIEYEIVRGITPEQFEAQVEDNDVTIIDVRSPEEVAEGKIEKSINIPVTSIEEDINSIIDLLPKDKDAKILIHCKAGVRAGRAITPIVELGYKNAYFLDHAITISPDGTYVFE